MMSATLLSMELQEELQLLEQRLQQQQQEFDRLMSLKIIRPSSTPDEMSVVLCDVIEGRDIAGKDLYVSLQCGPHQVKTGVVKRNGSRVIWNKSFQFDVTNVDLTGEYITLTVSEYNQFTSDDILGVTRIAVQLALKNHESMETWFTLHQPSLSSSGSPAGQLRLKLWWIPLGVNEIKRLITTTKTRIEDRGHVINLLKRFIGIPSSMTLIDTNKQCQVIVKVGLPQGIIDALYHLTSSSSSAPLNGRVICVISLVPSQQQQQQQHSSSTPNRVSTIHNFSDPSALASIRRHLASAELSSVACVLYENGDLVNIDHSSCYSFYILSDHVEKKIAGDLLFDLYLLRDPSISTPPSVHEIIHRHQSMLATVKEENDLVVTDESPIIHPPRKFFLFRSTSTTSSIVSTEGNSPINDGGGGGGMGGSSGGGSGESDSSLSMNPLTPNNQFNESTTTTLSATITCIHLATCTVPIALLPISQHHYKSMDAALGSKEELAEIKKQEDHHEYSIRITLSSSTSTHSTQCIIGHLSCTSSRSSISHCHFPQLDFPLSIKHLKNFFILPFVNQRLYWNKVIVK